MSLPLPRVVPDVGPGGPLVTAMRGGNALAQDMLNTSITGAKAEYAPWTEYSNAASKLAYSQFVGPQAIANMLTNPATRGMMTPEQHAQLSNVFAQQVNNPAMSMANMPIPHQREGGMFGNIINYLRNMGRGNPPSQPPMQQPMQGGSMPMPQQGMQGQGADSGYSYDAQGRNVVASPQQVAAIAQGGNNAFNAPTPQSGQGMMPGQTQLDRTASQVQPPGVMGGYNPQSVTTAQEAAIKTQATGEKEAENAMWKGMLEQSSEQAINAQNVLDLTNEFSQAYDETSKYEKGPGYGRIPALFSAAADTADRAAAGMADAVARAQQEGHITQTDRATYLSMKPSRTMRKEAKDNAINFMKGMNERVQEHAVFNTEAKRMGYSPQEANSIWLNYIKKNPFYDAKSKSLLTKNFNKWPEYLKPEKAEQALRPKASGNQATWKVYNPQGKLIATGDEESVNNFLADHKGYYRKK